MEDVSRETLTPEVGIPILRALGIAEPGLTEGPAGDIEVTWATLARFSALLEGIARPRGLVGFDRAELDREVMRSLLMLAVIPPAELPADVGSGAGLPGIPLCIARRGGLLIEPRSRAVAFLEHAVRSLELPVDVVRGRAEDCATGPLGNSLPVVVARALAPPEKSAALLAPLCRPGGTVAIAAGPDPEELPSLEIAVLGLRQSAIMRIGPAPGLPPDIRQNIIVLKKMGGDKVLKNRSRGTSGPA